MKRVFLLTGTPAMARPRELYNLCAMTRPDVFMEFKPFGIRYCDPVPGSKWDKSGIDYNGSTCNRELHYFLKNSIMIRRLKEEVLKDLPDKTRVKVPVALDKNTEVMLNRLLDEARGKSSGDFVDVIKDLKDRHRDGEFAVSSTNENNYRSGGSIFDTIMKCWYHTGIGKIEGGLKFLEEFMLNDIKFLVFAHHLEVLDAVEDFIKNKTRKGYMRIDGSTKPEERQN